MIASDDVDLKTVLDDRYPLDETDEAFEAFLTGVTCNRVFDASALRE